MNKFRTLRADEIECRVATVSAKGCSLLLYKDARCDQNILDETVGPMNWQRHHTRDNANCIVAIWDDTKSQWIEKEDTGTESFTEKEKGLASDSFKRACFNWGIGRELYTAPFIWVNAGNVNLEDGTSGRKTTRDRFSVKEIGYDEKGNINALEIYNESKKAVVYTFGKTSGQKADDRKVQEISEKTIDTIKMGAINSALERAGIPLQKVLDHFGITSIGEVTEKMFLETTQMISKFEAQKK